MINIYYYNILKPKGLHDQRPKARQRWDDPFIVEKNSFGQCGREPFSIAWHETGLGDGCYHHNCTYNVSMTIACTLCSSNPFHERAPPQRDGLAWHQM